MRTVALIGNAIVFTVAIVMAAVPFLLPSDGGLYMPGYFAALLLPLTGC